MVAHDIVCDEPREGIRPHRSGPGHCGDGHLRRELRPAGRGRRRIPAHARRGPLRREDRAEPAADLGRAHRSGGRRSHCRVRGISHPFDQDRGASLRASSGRAVGQRVGTLATIGGSRRSRAADGARGHRGAEPARSLDRGRHRRRPREYCLGRRVRMEGRRHAYARHTRYSIQHRHCGTGGHPRRGRVPRPDQHRYGFGGRVEPGSCRGAGRGLPRLHGRPRPHPQADWYQRPPTAIAGRSRDVLRAGNILAGLHHRSPQWTTTDVHARPGVLCGENGVLFHAVRSRPLCPGDECRQRQRRARRRKRDVADDAPRQRDRRCRGVEHRARQHGRSRAKSG